jgi:hypothetical protein
MSDIVVTVPLTFQFSEFPGLRGLDAWCAEGDAAGEEPSGRRWRFTTYGGRPRITPGERVYVVCEDRLRGYAPLVELQCEGRAVHLIRAGGAVAITIPDRITGFRGWRYCWWDRDEEEIFPGWMIIDRRDWKRQRQIR